MTIGELLTLRSQWEEIVSFRKTYDLPHYDGTLENLKWFVENGAKGNRFRKRFDDALELANIILESATCDSVATVNTSMTPD